MFRRNLLKDDEIHHINNENINESEGSETPHIEMLKLERRKSYLSEPLLVDNYHYETRMHGDHLMLDSSDEAGEEWWECQFEEHLISPRRS